MQVYKTFRILGHCLECGDYFITGGRILLLGDDHYMVQFWGGPCPCCGLLGDRELNAWDALKQLPRDVLARVLEKNPWLTEHMTVVKIEGKDDATPAYIG